jgi:hypothetical protein
VHTGIKNVLEMFDPVAKAIRVPASCKIGYLPGGAGRRREENAQQTWRSARKMGFHRFFGLLNVVVKTRRPGSGNGRGHDREHPEADKFLRDAGFVRLVNRDL